MSDIGEDTDPLRRRGAISSLPLPDGGLLPALGDWLNACRPTVLGIAMFRQISLRAIGVAACLSLILISVQLLGMLGFLFSATNAFSVTLKTSVLLLVPIIPIMLPFAFLYAAFRTYDDMHEDSELIAMAAFGRSGIQCAAPAMASAAMLSVLCLMVGLFVEPAANRVADELKRSISINLLSSAARDGSLIKIGDALSVRIGEVTENGGLVDVLIVDSRSGDREGIYVAKRGHLVDQGSGSSIVLVDGEIVLRARGSNDSTRVQFASYAVSLLEAQRSAESPAGIRSLSTQHLLSTCTPECDGAEKQEITVELLRRFSDWLYLLTFAALAAWAGSRATPNRGSARAGMVTLMVACMVLRGLGFVALTESRVHPEATALVFLIPLLPVFCLMAATYFDVRFIAEGAFSSRRLEGFLAALLDRIHSGRSASREGCR